MTNMKKRAAVEQRRGRHADAARRVLVSIAVGLFLCSVSVRCQRTSRVPNSGRVTECRVSFHTVDGQAFADVCVDDESLIDQMVLRPMRNATRDPNPAAYAVVGTLSIISTDGSRETLVLFSPWGHYGRGNDYFVADFSDLQIACEGALRDAKRLMDADKAIRVTEQEW